MIFLVLDTKLTFLNKNSLHLEQQTYCHRMLFFHSDDSRYENWGQKREKVTASPLDKLNIMQTH